MLSDPELSQAGNMEGLLFQKPQRENCLLLYFHFNAKKPPSEELKASPR
jgi:hypothetical protein